MQEALLTLEQVRQIAELGLKHSQGRVFPIDRMADCLRHIIELTEKHKCRDNSTSAR